MIVLVIHQFAVHREYVRRKLAETTFDASHVGICHCISAVVAVITIPLPLLVSRIRPTPLAQIGSFDIVAKYVFPAWFALVAVCFLFFETRKQYRRYFSKGRAKILGVVEIVNEAYVQSTEDSKERLMPRTQVLPIYTFVEFNEKVCQGSAT